MLLGVAMSFNIAAAIHERVTPEEVQHLATTIGAPADKTRNAVSIGVLGIVGSLIQHASSPAGAAGILQVLTSPTLGGVSPLWRSFLGGNGDKVTDVVAKTSGIETSSAHRVLAMLLPTAGTVLGRKITEGDLAADGLMKLLASQKDVFVAMPGAAAIVASLGIPGLAATKVPVTTPSSHGKARFLPMVVAAVALALGALLVGTLMRRPVSQTTTTGAELPNTEVVLERLTFDFATANVQERTDTIERIARSMKEHPASVLRLEGHIDQDAEAVKKMLVDRGVDAKRIEVVGMGKGQPVAPNDTEELREKSRRIDAVMLKR